MRPGPEAHPLSLPATRAPLQACLQQNGFKGVQTFVTDARNRLVAGVAP